MDLRRALDVSRTWWKAIVVATLLAGVAAFAISSVLPRVYEGQARLLVGQGVTVTGTDANQFDMARNLAATYAEIARTRPVLERVMASVGIVGVPVFDFSETVSVVASRDQPIIDIVASDGDPVRAAAIANAIAAELVALAPAVAGDDPSEAVREDLELIDTQLRQVRDELATLVDLPSRTDAQQARLEILEARLVQLQAIHATLLQVTTTAQTNRVTVIEPAAPPDGPASPRPLFNTAIGLALGLLGAIAIAFAWNALDDRLRTREDIERITGLATLGSVLEMPTDDRRPEMYRLTTLLYPRSPAAESFRALRTNIEFASVDEGIRSVVITSATPGEGKSIVAANLAIVFAQAGRRTLLVDADLRRPSLATLFSLEATRGLTDLVRTEGLRPADVARETEVPNLRVIPSGPLPANPAEFTGSHRMEVTIAAIVEDADVVIVDAPPVGAVTDAALLAARVDATILVVRSARASERVVRRAREALAKVNANVIGAVLNGVAANSEESGVYYGVYAPAGGPALVGPDPVADTASATPAGGASSRTQQARRQSGD